MPRPNNPKPPGILRDVPSHMFASWNAHAMPPNDVPVGSSPCEFVWIASDSQLATIPVSQASTVQAAPNPPVAGPSHPHARVDHEAQESTSADPIRRSHRQRTRGAAPIHIPTPNIFVDDAPITTTDYGFPSPSPCALPAAASYSPHAPSPHASHAPRFHPYLPPSHRHPSQQATRPEETHASPSHIHGAETFPYASGGDVPPQSMAHDSEPEVRSTSYHDPDSGLYPRFSVDPATGAYYWAGTMNLAALDEPAVRRVPSRYCATDVPIPDDCLPHGQQPAPPFQFPPFAYPSAFPHAMPPFFGQDENGVAGPAQPYPQEEEDIVMGDDQQDVYQQEQGYANPYPHWGIPESQDGWNATLLHDSALGPSASHEPLAADPQAGLFNAPLLPAPDGWPFQPQDGNLQPPQGSHGQYQW